MTERDNTNPSPNSHVNHQQGQATKQVRTSDITCIHASFAWKKTTTTPPPLFPTPPPQSNKPTPKLSILSGPRGLSPGRTPAISHAHPIERAQPSPAQPRRVGGFGFRLSARVCRRVYLAFRVSLSSKARQRLSRLERAGKRASKQLNRMGGGGLRAGLHDEDNEDEGPLLVMLGRVSFRGTGMVDGGCFFLLLMGTNH